MTTIHDIPRPPRTFTWQNTPAVRLDLDLAQDQPTIADFDCPSCEGPTTWRSAGSCYHGRSISVDRTENAARIDACQPNEHDFDWDQDRNWECSECGYIANEELWQNIDTYFSERA